MCPRRLSPSATFAFFQNIVWSSLAVLDLIASFPDFGHDFGPGGRFGEVGFGSFGFDGFEDGDGLAVVAGDEDGCAGF